MVLRMSNDLRIKKLWFKGQKIFYIYKVLYVFYESGIIIFGEIFFSVSISFIISLAIDLTPIVLNTIINSILVKMMGVK